MRKSENIMIYKRLGNSGIKLPIISLGLWHNFGDVDQYDTYRETLLTAFNKGIVHFDLANNYGPPPGSAESNFGKILRADLSTHRDELFISSKAGHLMWEGPYGDWASRKSLIASCDQSLKRVGVDYFDLFYSHRFDPETPLEETMAALDYIVRSGRALYVGLSKYPVDKARKAYAILQHLGTPCVVNQEPYSILNRHIESDILPQNMSLGVGMVSFSPLAQGLLTNRYLKDVPSDSRAAKAHGFLQVKDVTKSIDTVKALDTIAANRGQTLAQMALAWQLHDARITSVIVGASSSKQLEENLKAIDQLSFTTEELKTIDSLSKQH